MLCFTENIIRIKMFLKLNNSDMESFIKYGKKYLILSGNWPMVNSKWLWLYKLYLNFFARGIMLIFFVCFSIYIYQCLEDVKLMIEAAYISIPMFVLFFKYSIFTIREDQFIKLLKDLDNPYFQTMDRQQKYVDNWMNVALFYCRQYNRGVILCVSSFMLFPFLDKSEIRKLPFNVWTPFDINKSSSAYITVYILELALCFVGSTLTMSFDVLPNVMMNISCAQMEILKDNLENSIQQSPEVKQAVRQTEIENILGFEIYIPLNKNENEKVMDNLCRCLEHHDAIIRLLEDIEKFFNPGLLVHFLANCVSFIIIGLQMMTIPVGSAEFTSAFSYMIMVLVQLFLYCWNGHQVIVHSTTIGDSCYNMEWYRCNNKVRQILFMIMERCKRPNKVKAGGIFILSIVTFTRLMRTSYQYFTILRSAFNNQ